MSAEAMNPGADEGGGAHRKCATRALGDRRRVEDAPRGDEGALKRRREGKPRHSCGVSAGGRGLARTTTIQGRDVRSRAGLSGASRVVIRTSLQRSAPSFLRNSPQSVKLEPGPEKIIGASTDSSACHRIGVGATERPILRRVGKLARRDGSALAVEAGRLCRPCREDGGHNVGPATVRMDGPSPGGDTYGSEFSASMRPPLPLSSAASSTVGWSCSSNRSRGLRITGARSFMTCV